MVVILHPIPTDGLPARRSAGDGCAHRDPGDERQADRPTAIRRPRPGLHRRRGTRPWGVPSLHAVSREAYRIQYDTGVLFVAADNSRSLHTTSTRLGARSLAEFEADGHRFRFLGVRVLRAGSRSVEERSPLLHESGYRCVVDRHDRDCAARSKPISLSLDRQHSIPPCSVELIQAEFESAAAIRTSCHS